MLEVDTALGNMWGQLSSHSSLKERINIGKMFASAEECSRKGEEVMLEGKELPLHLSLQKAVLFCFHGAAIVSFLQALEHPMCASACASGPALDHCLLCRCYSRAATASPSVQTRRCSFLLCFVPRQYCSSLALMKIALQCSVSNSCAPKIVFLTWSKLSVGTICEPETSWVAVQQTQTAPA